MEVGMILEISVAVIALAFAALVFYIISMIKSLQVTLSQVNQLLRESREQLDEIADEAKKVMEHTNNISADVQRKVESLDPLFKVVEDIGEVLEHKSEHLVEEERKAALSKKQPIEKEMVQDSVKAFADIVELTALGLRLWRNLKKRR